ncbi:MAG: SGNH/GDSL hydrolase family protein [Chloroflexota bacterium]
MPSQPSSIFFFLVQPSSSKVVVTRMWSYFGRFLSRNFQLIQAARAGEAFGVEDRVEEKKAVNAQIMNHAAAHAEDNGWPMAFVIFYSRGEFDNDSWREPFMREVCQQHTCIDTKIALEEAVASSGRPIGDFYLDDGLHLNAEGNQLVAEYIVSEMEKLQLIR